MREADSRRRKEGAHGGSEGRSGSLVAAAAASRATLVSPSTSSNFMETFFSFIENPFLIFFVRWAF